MTAAKNKLRLDEAMPLVERCAYAGLREIFDKHAREHGFLVEDMLISRMPGAGPARRALVAKLQEEHGLRVRLIAWTTGFTMGYVKSVLSRERRRRGLPAGTPKLSDREIQKRWNEIMGRPAPKAHKPVAPPKAAKKDNVVRVAEWEGLQRALGGEAAPRKRRRAASVSPIEQAVRGVVSPVSLLGDDPEPTEEDA
jgi:hypothetical protein